MLILTWLYVIVNIVVLSKRPHQSTSQYHQKSNLKN